MKYTGVTQHTGGRNAPVCRKGHSRAEARVRRSISIT